MKIESKKLIGTIILSLAVLGSYISCSAQSVYIRPNPNNQYFFGSSAYASNYYANNWDYERNHSSPCYGYRQCYSINYLNYTYPTYNYSYYNNQVDTYTYQSNSYEYPYRGYNYYQNY